MRLAFVVPAHNEEHELGAALAAIRVAASGHEYEVVVVDDASTDRTAEIARDAGARVVAITRRQIAAARNAGAAAAHADVLFFVDADTRVAPLHVTGALTALQDGYVGGGARIGIYDDVPRWATAPLRVFSAIYFGCNFGAGAFLFTTAENFGAIGGFDEQYFAGEEIYLTRALRRLGRFTVLREPVLTSGRKLRMHSARKILTSSAKLILLGPIAAKSRKHLDLWYDGKRETAA